MVRPGRMLVNAQKGLGIVIYSPFSMTANTSDSHHVARVSGALGATKLPIIEFRVSRIYNAQWTRPKELQSPPPPTEWANRERRLKQLWAKHGRAVLQTMSHVTGLPWREDRIIAYLTWGVRPFSDPLTLNLRADVVSVFETLTHELIHRIVSQPLNNRRIRPRWHALVKRYPREDPLAVNHIPIHAVHDAIWRQLFPKRTAALRTDLKHPAYVRSWELVDTIGPEQIVKRLFSQARRRTKRR